MADGDDAAVHGDDVHGDGRCGGLLEEHGDDGRRDVELQLSKQLLPIQPDCQIKEKTNSFICH